MTTQTFAQQARTGRERALSQAQVTARALFGFDINADGKRVELSTSDAPAREPGRELVLVPPEISLDQRASSIMLDKDESAAMAQWSADPDAGSPPIPDAERRVDLQKRLVVAEAQARAATGAMSGPRAAMNAAGIRVSAAQRQAWIAAKLVAIEEAESTLAPLKAAIAQIYECKRRVDAARGAFCSTSSLTKTREKFSSRSPRSTISAARRNRSR